MTDSAKNDKQPLDFIRQIITDDVKAGKNDGCVATRFPPEPNGYLHIGHAKAIYLNYSVAKEFGGTFNLRFDDTNPVKEDDSYIDAIKRDVRWLGCDFGERVFFASSYFGQMYDYAVELIKSGKAYVCDLTAEETRVYRGNLTSAGKNSPYRDRTIEESLDLFAQMKAGEFEDGARTLKAKIDMASPNLNMRDPVLYRIVHTDHHQSGDDWCIYPMYDWAHGLEDSIEGITHSLCSLEFENHRPLYDWFLNALGVCHPQQIEFARLNLTYTVMSKRLLAKLVDENHVTGWDDPRLPTLSGLRRRGYSTAAIRNFLDTIGVAKFVSTIDLALLEHCLRQDLNKTCLRAMAVLNPLKVTIENYPDDKVEYLEAINNPENPADGTRKVAFSKVLYIERDDFMEEPTKKFYRLSPSREVRLRYAYFVTCKEAIYDADGNVIELICTYDPATRGGDSPDGRKVKATLHWVDAATAVDAEVRLYDTLFTVPNPTKTKGKGDFTANLNPDSMKIVTGCKLEAMLAKAEPFSRWQFERLGYFCADSDSSSSDKIVFNRTVALKDTWAKLQKQQAKQLANRKKQKKKT